MIILSLDIAEHRTGWLLGPAGKIVSPHLLLLKKDGDRTQDAAAKFARWLRDLFEKNHIDLICMEGYLPAGASRDISSQAVREGQIGLHYVVRAIAACYGIEVRAPSPQTIRKHFCGRISGAPKRATGYKRSKNEAAQDRIATKLMVLNRAKELGYLPQPCMDDDMADAAAIHNYASAIFAGHYANTGASLL